MRLVLLAALLMPVSAGASPSFDCRAAKSNAEKAICADRELSKLDQEIADAYVQALGRLAADPGAVDSLKKAQRDFIETRDGDGLGALSFHLGRQSKFLRKIVGRRKDFLGAWASRLGDVAIGKSVKGAFSVAAETLDGRPPSFRGCSWSDERAKVHGGAIVSKAADGRTLRMTRRGPLLVAVETGPQKDPDGGEAERDCAAGGAVAGIYFPAVEDQDEK